MSLTKLSQDGNTVIKLFPARKGLVSDIPAGDGKTANLFLQCGGRDSRVGNGGVVGRLKDKETMSHVFIEFTAA